MCACCSNTLTIRNSQRCLGQCSGLPIVDCEQVPINIHFLKVNNRNTKKRCKICLKLTIKTPEQGQ